LSKTEIGKLFVGGGHTVKEWSRTENRKDTQILWSYLAVLH